MKNHLLLASILLFSLISARAQYWAPLNLTDQYNYRLENSDEYISNILWVDSVTVSGGDSIFHLNRIVIECDTCTFYPPVTCADLLKDQGQFLQKRMIKMPDGTYRFEGKINFTLNVLGKTGDNWIFNDVDDIEATIVETSEESLFSQLDSVKIIELSNGQIIKLSKNFGILEFPRPDTSLNYSLVGIKGHNLGALIPGYQTVYDYEAGDELQYLVMNWGHCHGGIGLGYSYSYAIKTKLEILHKTVFTDSIAYQVHRLRAYSKGTAIYKFDEDTITWTVTKYSVPENYPGNYSPVTWKDTVLVPIVGNYSSAQQVIKRIRIKQDTDNYTTIEYTNLSDSYCEYYSNQYFNPDILSLLGYFRYHDLDFRFIDQTGLSYFKHFEAGGQCSHGESAELVGYKIGLKTDGTILPDSFYHPGNKLSLSPWPNPVRDILKLTFAGPTTEDLNLIIFNASGQIARRQTIKKGTNPAMIDFSNFPAGLYIIRLKGEKTNIVEKVLKL